MLYLDNAATTAVRPEVTAAMMPYLTEWVGNPSSHHTFGEAAAEALDDARRRIARVAGMRASDVVFTSGGTEANNLALKGITLGAARARGARHVVTTPIEHESVLASIDYLTHWHDVEVTTAPVDDAGLVDPAVLAGLLRDDTALVSIGWANNEVGTVQDAAGLAAVTRARRVPLHLDAVQAAGWLPLAEANADALSIAGHKIGTPHGIGALLVRGRVPVEPLLHGGGQERGRRSGTENVAGAVGLAVALELAEAERAQASVRVAALRDTFVAAVLDRVRDAQLTGHATRRLPGTASFVFPGTSGEAVLLHLERRGIVSSSGSACAAGSDDPSHVLVALGIDPAVAQTAVRFTFSHRVAHRVDPRLLAEAVAASVAAVASGG